MKNTKTYHYLFKKSQMSFYISFSHELVLEVKLFTRNITNYH